MIWVRRRPAYNYLINTLQVRASYLTAWVVFFVYRVGFNCRINYCKLSPLLSWYWNLKLRPLSYFIQSFYLIIPHATSCGGYNVFDPSVSKSVSPVFLVSTTPLKPLNRISWNFVVMKDIMCRCAYPQEILIPFFFSELRPFWT